MNSSYHNQIQAGTKDQIQGNLESAFSRFKKANRIKPQANKGLHAN